MTHSTEATTVTVDERPKTADLHVPYFYGGREAEPTLRFFPGRVGGGRATRGLGAWWAGGRTDPPIFSRSWWWWARGTRGRGARRAGGPNRPGYFFTVVSFMVVCDVYGGRWMGARGGEDEFGAARGVRHRRQLVLGRESRLAGRACLRTCTTPQPMTQPTTTINTINPITAHPLHVRVTPTKPARRAAQVVGVTASWAGWWCETSPAACRSVVKTDIVAAAQRLSRLALLFLRTRFLQTRFLRTLSGLERWQWQ